MGWFPPDPGPAVAFRLGVEMLGTHQLNVFVTAVETLSFTKTAKRLHLTQSSVSQHIKALESQLGVELFLRQGRSLAVTDAGNVLLPMAREIVEGSIRAAERMELIKKQVHGHLMFVVKVPQLLHD